ncbi:MAG: 6-phosphogluconolactonase [Verrucomicrobiota bacterium]
MVKEFSFEKEEAWIESLLEHWQDYGSQCLAARGSFSVALSGGNSPLAFYRALAQINWTWDATELFIGDERRVPPEHPDSHYRNIWESFHPRRVKLHRWKTEESDLQKVAQIFEKNMSTILGRHPKFDLVLLGVGNDGHTASLFPESPALEVKNSYAVANPIQQQSTTRLTITYPVIERARQVWFLVKGQEKQLWIEKMKSSQDPTFPVTQAFRLSNQAHIFYCTR